MGDRRSLGRTAASHSRGNGSGLTQYRVALLRAPPELMLVQHAPRRRRDVRADAHARPERSDELCDQIMAHRGIARSGMSRMARRLDPKALGLKLRETEKGSAIQERPNTEGSNAGCAA